MCCLCEGIERPEGLDVRQDRVFLQVIADDLGDERIDPLVVGHAGADGVGQAELPARYAPIRPGDAELAVAAEGQGVEEVVVDPAVDHVDPLRPAGRPHEDLAAVEEQVAPLDQLDAHLAGEEAVLVIGRVVDARASARRPSGRPTPAGAMWRSIASRFAA